MSTPTNAKKKKPALQKDSLYELILGEMKREPNPIDCCWIAQVARKFPAREDAAAQRQAIVSIDEALAERLEKVVTRRFLSLRAREGCGDERLLDLLRVIPTVSPSQESAQAFARVRELVIYSIGEIRARGYSLFDSWFKDPLAARF